MTQMYTDIWVHLSFHEQIGSARNVSGIGRDLEVAMPNGSSVVHVVISP